MEQSPGVDERRLILGLGNPGPRFEGTRHNRGREVVEELVRRRGLSLDDTSCATRLAVDDEVILATPETFMNRSGYAARCLLETRGLSSESLLVVYDDVALPLGSLRLRTRGGPAGQNGMASVIETLRSDRVPRLRLGIAPCSRDLDGEELTDFVLTTFDEEERDMAARQISRAADACDSWLEHGAVKTMNEFNAPIDAAP